MSQYPSFSGNVHEKVDEYFSKIQVPNLPQQFETIQALSGTARSDALKEDVRLRAADAQPTDVTATGKRLKRNHPEAYDRVPESVFTPGGSERIKHVKQLVSTPVFEERMKSRASKYVSEKVALSVKEYQHMQKYANEDGFVQMKRPKATETSSTAKSHVISKNTHLLALEAKEKTIHKLRQQIHV